MAMIVAQSTPRKKSSRNPALERSVDLKLRLCLVVASGRIARMLHRQAGSGLSTEEGTRPGQAA
jgi:hypothetical protein